MSEEKRLTWHQLGSEQLELIELLDSLEEPCLTCNGVKPMNCMACLGSGVQSVDEETRLAITQQIAAYQKMQVSKVDPTAALIRELDHRAAADKAESERLAARAKRWQSRYDFVKRIVLEFLIATNTKKIEGQHSTFTRRGNGGLTPLDVHEPNLLPRSCVRVTLMISHEEWRTIADAASRGGMSNGTLLNFTERLVAEPDNAVIRAALERGEHVAGARLLDRGEHLRVS